MALSEAVLEKVRARQALPAPAARRAIRTAAGLTQGDIAAEVGVATETVSRWEAGSHEPRLDHLVAYARVLDELRGLA